MSYQRQEIDPGCFADLMPEGAKLAYIPKLPTIQFKRDGVKYTVSDVRLLHPYGVQALTMVINTMIRDPEATECTIVCGDGVSDDDIAIMQDIVMGFRYEATKGGKNGWLIGGGFVGSCETRKDEDGAKVTFRILYQKLSSAIHQAAEGRGETIGLIDLIISAVECERREMEKEVKHDEY